MTIAIITEHKSASYSPRTYHNASVADLTVAIAVDFNTAGEKCTRKAAGSKYIHLPFNEYCVANARTLWKEITKRKAKVLNIAGNGIYTFEKHGIEQAAINQYVYELLGVVHMHYKIDKIVSGGQTGVDIAGIVAAEALGIESEATLPKGLIQRFSDGKDIQMTREGILKQIEDGVKGLKR